MLISCNLSEVLAVGVVPSERRTPKRHKKARKEDIRLVGTYLSFLSWDNKDYLGMFLSTRIEGPPKHSFRPLQVPLLLTPDGSLEMSSAS